MFHGERVWRWLRLLSSALALATLLLPSCSCGQVAVRLDYTAMANNATLCIGGQDALTDTSPRLQYRLSSQPESWVERARLNLTSAAGQQRSLTDSFDVDEEEEWVQFRVLQLEHGGGSCNCWMVNSMSLQTGPNALTPVLRQDVCYSQPRSSQPGVVMPVLMLCMGNAAEARGGVTRLFYFNSTQDQSEEKNCSGFDNRLISNQGPSLPATCSDQNLQM